MAKKRDDRDDSLPEGVTALSGDQLPDEVLSQPIITPPPPAPALPLLTFDRYFASTGKPGHHKAGMAAYLQRRGGPARKTKEAWDSLFAQY